MAAYYNEFDPFAAQWLRNLIEAGVIAAGDVDERSIEEVVPNDLRGYTQCHFFAGIGVWSHALRGAGWDDSRPVWTGSCPCQPFSTAGAGKGEEDERHLWPAWYRLIVECKPAVVFGEQVAAAIRFGWLDLVQSDLEREGYAVGKAVLGACSVGAPHIRQRLYFVADSENIGRNGRGTGEAVPEPRTQQRFERCSDAGVVGNALNSGLEGHGQFIHELGAERREDSERHGSTSGFWGNAEWVGCRDGKFRPVEPGTFPLAHGTAKRVGRLRGYGNAICAEVAKEFVTSYLEAA